MLCTATLLLNHAGKNLEVGAQHTTRVVPCNERKILFVPPEKLLTKYAKLAKLAKEKNESALLG